MSRFAQRCIVLVLGIVLQVAPRAAQQSTTPVGAPAAANGCDRQVPVTAQDTCQSLASGNDITLAQIQAFNPGVDCNLLQLGSSLCVGNFLPQPSSCAQTHTVQSGDTCTTIGQMGNPQLSPDQLQQLNPNLPCNNIPIDWIACIQATGVAPAPACATPYVIQPGDICFDIANKHGTTADALEASNPGLDCSLLQLGTTLCLPAGSTVPTAQPVPSPPPGSTATPSPNAGSGSSSNTGAIVGEPRSMLTSAPPAMSTSAKMSLIPASLSIGGVVGGVAAVIIAALLLAVFLVRRKRSAGRARRTGPADEEMLSSLASSQMTSSAAYSSKGQESQGAHSKDSDKVMQAAGMPQRAAAGTSTGTGMSSSGSRPANALLDRRRSSAASAEPFDWRIDAGSIRICQQPSGDLWKLGSGATGTVFKALLDDVNEVAVKKLSPGVLTNVDSHLGRFREEIQLMAACRHRNVVQFFGASLEPEEMFMVTELMAGDLFSALRESRAQGKSEWLWYNRGRGVALDVARGLTYLHSKNFIHFDVKSLNILLAFDGTAKLADVGLAQALQLGTHLSQTTLRGTFAYIAPELLTGQRCTAKLDVFSLGTVLWELCSGEQPSRGRNRKLRIPEECPPAIGRLIDRCLEFEPANRPTAKEVVQLIQASPGLKS